MHPAPATRRRPAPPSRLRGALALIGIALVSPARETQPAAAPAAPVPVAVAPTTPAAPALCEADQVSPVEGDQVLQSADRVEQLVVLWRLPGLDRFNDLGQGSHATYFSLLISSSWLGRL